MSDQINPYRSPEQVGNVLRPAGRADQMDTWAMAAWPIVFGMNAIVPALFGWSVSVEHGRLGIALAAAALLAKGWLLCWRRPAWARLLMMGSIPIAVTQIFPIVHFAVGVFALIAAEALGLGHPSPPQLKSELAGFVVTLLGMLLAGAALVGALLGMMPGTWFARKD